MYSTYAANTWAAQVNMKGTLRAPDTYCTTARGPCCPPLGSTETTAASAISAGMKNHNLLPHWRTAYRVTGQCRRQRLLSRSRQAASSG